MNYDEMSSKELLAMFQARLDEEAREAKKNGKLVCWSASVAPPEMCVAMDIAMVYPARLTPGKQPEKAAALAVPFGERACLTFTRQI